MPKTISARELVMYAQTQGPGQSMEPVGIGLTGMAEKPKPGAGRGVVWGQDQYGNPVAIAEVIEAPGGLGGGTIEFYDREVESLFEMMQKTQDQFPIQVRRNRGGSLDNPRLWTSFWHLGRVHIGQIGVGAGPGREFMGGPLVNTAAHTYLYMTKVLRSYLTRLTIAEAEDLTDIALVTMVARKDAGFGYPGHDKIIFVSANAGSGVTANLYVSVNGGGAFTVLSTDPFAADEHAGMLAWNIIANNQVRLITGRITADAAAPAEIGYADLTYGAMATASWTTVNVGSTNNEVIQAICWPKLPGYFNRLYIAAGGDIWLSTDGGETIESTALLTGTTQINKIVEDYEGVIWAVGASNLLLAETNKSGVFESKTGPTGSDDSTAIAVANNGVVFLGNGTSIFRAESRALDAIGDWTNKKNFGVNMTIKDIRLGGTFESQGGDSELVWALVSDDVGNNGYVWFSPDGGKNWEMVTTLTNGGYAAWARSSFTDNLAFIAGPADGTSGIIHKLAPSV